MTLKKNKQSSMPHRFGAFLVNANIEILTIIITKTFRKYCSTRMKSGGELLHTSRLRFASLEE